MTTLPEISLAPAPDRIILRTNEPLMDMQLLAEDAVELAKRRMPKVTGHAANTLSPIYGTDWFGIYFPDKQVWFLEQGIKPFTMRSLHGPIPMWIDDPTGAERRANPKAKTRATVDGRTQILIFRYAAAKGSRKTVQRRNRHTGALEPVTVPRSYPGAPGRIVRREAAAPLTRIGAKGGRIAGNNGGVRWRHPGIVARQFMNSALADTALGYGIEPGPLYLADNATFYQLVGL